MLMFVACPDPVEELSSSDKSTIEKIGGSVGTSLTQVYSSASSSIPSPNIAGNNTIFAPEPNNSAATAINQFTVNSQNGGSLTAEGSYDSVTQKMTLTVTYNNWKTDDGIIINGTLNYNATVTANGCNANSSGSFTLSGSVSGTYTMNVTMNLITTPSMSIDCTYNATWNDKKWSWSYKYSA